MKTPLTPVFGPAGPASSQIKQYERSAEIKNFENFKNYWATFRPEDTAEKVKEIYKNNYSPSVMAAWRAQVDIDNNSLEKGAQRAFAAGIKEFQRVQEIAQNRENYMKGIAGGINTMWQMQQNEERLNAILSKDPVLQNIYNQNEERLKATQSKDLAATSSITSETSKIFTSNAQASEASKNIEKLINLNGDEFKRYVLSETNENSLEKNTQNALTAAYKQYESQQQQYESLRQQNQSREQQDLAREFAGEVQNSLKDYTPGTPKQPLKLPGERALSDQVQRAVADKDLYDLDPSLYRDAILNENNLISEKERIQNEFNAKQYDQFLKYQKDQTSQRSMDILQSNARKFEKKIEDLGSGFVEDFFGKLSNWSGAIPLQSFWVIVITFPPGLQSKLNAFVSEYDHKPWNDSVGGGYDQSVFYNLISSPWQDHVRNDYGYGCFFARSINVPGERVDTTSISVINQGLQFPNIIKGRNSPTEFGVSFMETNDSFIDVVLRPWTILGAYMGAVARPPRDSVKGTIDAIFYGKTDPGSNLVVRKSFKFHNVIPTEVNSQEYTQAGDALLVRPVKFLYSSYSMGNNTNYSAGQTVKAPTAVTAESVWGDGAGGADGSWETINKHKQGSGAPTQLLRQYDNSNPMLRQYRR